MEQSEPQRRSCCVLRQKIVVGIVSILSEAECGISDAELSDVMLFDLQNPSGKLLIGFKFCPWCGAYRDLNGEFRITEGTEQEDNNDLENREDNN